MKSSGLWNFYVRLIITASLGTGLVIYWLLSRIIFINHPFWISSVISVLFSTLLTSAALVYYFNSSLRNISLSLNNIILKSASSALITSKKNGLMEAEISRLIEYLNQQEQKLGFLEVQIGALINDWEKSLENNTTDWSVWEKLLLSLNDQFENLKSQSKKIIVVNQSLINSDADLARSMQKMAEDVTVTSKSANEGIRSVGREIRAINDLKITMGSSATVIKDLGDLSKHVGLFISTIATISHRTQLLSLNAGIEAARAGEAGRGFSVVANEIRTLSESSKKTTEDIAMLIHEIEQRTQNVIDLMQNTKKLEENIRVVYTAGDTFMDIVRELRQINAVVEKINQTHQAASSDSELINAMLVKLKEEINKTTQFIQQLNEASNRQQQAWQNILDFKREMAKRLKSRGA
jgi:methyl-accepting chemotaxis protein